MEDIFNNFKNNDVNNVCGLTDELNTLYILKYYKKNNQNILILTSSVYEANKYYKKMKTYTENVFFFPMDDFLTSVAVSISPEFKAQRLQTINNIKYNKPCIVITNLMGFLKYIPNKNIVDKSIINLKETMIIKRNELIEALDYIGYEKESLVTSTGEYSVRGFVIDIFPFNYDYPIRIEFFGDEIESIRQFDYDTQLSTKKINKIKILPYKEIISKDYSSIYDYLDEPIVFKIDNELINSSYKHLQEVIFDYKDCNNIDSNYKYMFYLNDIFVKKTICMNNIGLNEKNSITYSSQAIENFNGNIKLLKDFVMSKINKYTIIFMATNEKTIIDLIKWFDTNVNLDKILVNKINIIKQDINEGFIIDNKIYISENDIIKKNKLDKKQNIIKIGTKIKSFSDLVKGDYVVHRDHGIGIYDGVITLEVIGYKKDYLLIKYQGNDKVYVPVEKINTIYKYSDCDGIKPKINMLGSPTWEKTKRNVKEKITDIYDELLKLYTNHIKETVTPYLCFPEEIAFSKEFEYIETIDQIKCINEIDEDLSKDIPMDRLLCGDVGFGKTEVAFRSMFKTVMNGFQVAYLCPTTILSKQQHEVAIKRFAKFNLNIKLLNRFTNKKESENIFTDLKNGKIDIIFGTHRLLNKNIIYYDLGLLIIDEEQRFGVMQKEKIKAIKKNVNVLTLSATPIPRTLKMSMSGLKDLSILDTPPKDRYPVQTYVLEENDILIKDIIYKEISRNGQVFLLYNNVKKIEDMYFRIKELIPDAKINFAHGQMKKIQLETIIEDFVMYKFDVLICSTIIETGIDIQNVNSLIVIDAQNFGLSQLYQLRGRVGRSNKIGYCYLMYNKNKVLNETAIKRLKAIKEFTELGSGYKIALRDLSIRGAGDLLGREQAGFIDSVGFNLYTQMIKEVVAEIKGKEIINQEEKPPLLTVDTHISPDYVADENIRIEIHNLINKIEDLKSLKEVKSEIEDRFGTIDNKIEIYMYEEWFEKLTQKLNIKKLVQTKEKIEIYLPQDLSSKINGEKLFLQTYNINENFKLKYQRNSIIISLKINNKNHHFIYDLVPLLLAINTHIE
ncbi:MAG: transcription-repair coupling factor [Bacilli bacterium]|nr:transcription-repair coupling factor [Bacilli bacterium]MDD4406591.1 transcription-repair coupling factor [Bacilli bacterium]